MRSAGCAQSASRLFLVREMYAVRFGPLSPRWRGLGGGALDGANATPPSNAPSPPAPPPRGGGGAPAHVIGLAWPAKIVLHPSRRTRHIQPEIHAYAHLRNFVTKAIGGGQQRMRIIVIRHDL